MIKIISLLLSIVFCESTMAAKSILLSIHRMDNNVRNSLFLNTNDQNQLVNVYIDLPGAIKLHSVDDIRRGTGIYFQKGIAIISLQSDDIDEDLGGNVKLIYLSEYKIASKNIYNEINLKILKDENSQWCLFRNGKKVTGVDAYPYTWGIKKLILK